MSKKILTFFTIVTVLLAMTALCVFAKEGYTDDFSTAPEDGMVKNYSNWSPYSDASEAGVTWDEGTIKFEKTDDTKPLWVMKTGASENVHFVMIDMMQNDMAITSNFSGYFYTPAGRIIFSLSNPTANEWYTYIFLSQYEMIDGEEKLCASIFRSLRGKDNWSKYSGPIVVDAQSAGAQFTFLFNSMPTGSVMWLDNVKTHGGLYYEGITVTDGEGNEIMTDGGLPEDITEINVTADIYNAGNLSSTMASDPQVIPVLGIVTLLDENGMMLDCATQSAELNYFENTFTVNLDIGNYDTSEISSVMFYVIDSIDGLVDVMAPTMLK